MINLPAYPRSIALVEETPPRPEWADGPTKDRARPASAEVDAILHMLAQRHSCRDYDSTSIDRAVIDAIVADGLQAPSSCNQQNWHFVIVEDLALKRRAREISGGNHHFEFCSVIIYLCFQKGWTHDNFSIVQSVAAACYHMMLSAHLRGFSSIWNAGIGDKGAVATMLNIPATFEIQGALCIGRPKPTAPPLKAPRRPLSETWSWNRFDRPPHAIYPAKPAAAYPFFSIHNADNPFAEWRPSVWGWDRIADFRGYSVWAKSPLAGVYRSRRQGDATYVEIGLLPDLAPGARLIDVMPWGGTHTTEIRRRLDPAVFIDIAELSANNLSFILERIRQEGLPVENTAGSLMPGGRFPYADASVDAVFLGQVLEHTPDPELVLDEVLRVLRPGGCAVVSVRNLWSRYGWVYSRRQVREQVANQGPFVPLPAPRVRRMLSTRFRIEREIGISLKPNTDATVYEGPLRFACRLYAARVIKPR